MNRFVLLACLLLSPPPATAAGGPRVAASIIPLHSLVTAVMEGVAEPKLLVPGGVSPHDYGLRPHEIRDLYGAQLVFWAGENLETFLVKPLANASSTKAVSLLETPGLELLRLRRSGFRNTHEDGTDSAMQKPDPAHGDYDPHAWLNPLNAIAMARNIGAVLADIDAENRAIYEDNTLRLVQGLLQLDQELDTLLAPVRGVPYAVLHDAYHYFENRYRLNDLGSLVVSPEHQVGARRMQEFRDHVSAGHIRCFFNEPQFEPALVEVLLEGTTVRSAVLDPVGASLAPGAGAYFALLRQMGFSLRTCLEE